MFILIVVFLMYKKNNTNSEDLFDIFLDEALNISLTQHTTSLGIIEFAEDIIFNGESTLYPPQKAILKAFYKEPLNEDELMILYDWKECQEISRTTWVDGREYSNLVLESGRGSGKALALDTPILTTTGWKTIETVKEGDYVFSPSGLPVKVIKESNIFIDNKVYKIDFSDNSFIYADANHQWVTWNKSTNISSIKTTEEIKNSLTTYNGKLNHFIKLSKPLKLPEVNLPIHPYLLGYWLGNDSSNTTNLKVNIEDYKEVLFKLDTIGVSYKIKQKCKNYYTVSISGFSEHLTNLNLLENKYVPKIYLLASEYQRLELLRGLMDAKGNFNKHGTINFINKNYEIIEAVYFLAASLEGNPIITNKNGGIYKVNIKLTKLNPFYISKKAERFSPHNQERFITNISEVESIPVKCIQVEGELYLAGKNLIPTHNSVMVAILALYEFYNLITLEDPAVFYGKMPGSPIDIFAIAQSLDQVKQTLFKAIKGFIDKSKYFSSLIKNKTIEVYAEEIKCPQKNVSLYAKHCRTESLVGYNIKCLILDEVSRFENDEEGISKADTLWDNVGRSCQYKEDLIYTSQGSITHKELLEKQNKNLKILTLDYKTYKQYFTDNYQVWSNGIKDIYTLTTKRGLEGHFTDNHPFLVLKDKIQWVELKDLKVGDKLAILNKLNFTGNASFISKNKARLLGYLLGNSNLNLNSIRFYTKYKSILEDFKNKLNQEYPECNLINNYIVSSSTYNSLNSDLSLLKLLGVNKENQCIPQEIINSSNEILAEFIAGLFSIKGYVNINKYSSYIGIKLTSKKIIENLQRELLRYSIMSIVKVNKNYYVLEIRDENSIKNFLIYIVIFLEEELKADKFNKLNYKTKDFYINNESDIVWDTIKSIEFFKKDETIAISIPETNIIGNPIISHNTVGRFGKHGKRIAISSAWEPGDAIEKLYNLAERSVDTLGFRLKTWQVNLSPTNTEEILKNSSEYIKDPVKAATEYEGIRSIRQNTFFIKDNVINSFKGNSACDAHQIPLDITNNSKEVRHYVAIKINRLEVCNNKPSFAHCDFGVKKDAAALAVCSPIQLDDKWGISVDILIAWKPYLDRDKYNKAIQRIVSFTNCEDVFIQIAKHRNIQKFSFDSYNSEGTKQRLHMNNIPTFEMSTSNTMQFIYFNTTKQLMDQGLLFLPKDSKWSTTAELELQNIFQLPNGKIHHPKEYGKDLADAITNAVYNCYIFMIQSGKFTNSSGLLSSINVVSNSKNPTSNSNTIYTIKNTNWALKKIKPHPKRNF